MRSKLLILSLFLIFSCDNSTKPSCTETIDCAGVCGGSSIEDACGECDGNGSTCVENRTWTIHYVTSTPIKGFQFDVTGVEVIDATGGDAGSAGFIISKSSTTVLGFSLSAATIPVGEGVLVVLEIAGSGNACILDSEEGDLVMSGNEGVELPASVIDCNNIHIP